MGPSGAISALGLDLGAAAALACLFVAASAGLIVVARRTGKRLMESAAAIEVVERESNFATPEEDFDYW